MLEEYLSLERESEIRHEYIAGEVVATGGDSPQHNRITVNLARKLGNALRGSNKCSAPSC
jgi:Uma2 family endonuclease